MASKKTPPAKKPVPVKKPASTKKPVPAKKRAPVKKAAPAKKAVSAQELAAVVTALQAAVRGIERAAGAAERAAAASRPRPPATGSRSSGGDEHGIQNYPVELSVNRGLVSLLYPGRAPLQLATVIEDGGALLLEFPDAAETSTQQRAALLERLNALLLFLQENTGLVRAMGACAECNGGSHN